MSTITFPQLSRANTAAGLNFIATADTGGDQQISYVNFLNSLRADILNNEIVVDEAKEYNNEQLVSMDVVLCDASALAAGMDITINILNDFPKPKVVTFIKDASYNPVRFSFGDSERPLNGSRVNFYAKDFYDLMLPNEGVRFLFYGNKIMVLDRLGWDNFSTEHLSNAPIPGSFLLDGSTTFDLSKWRRLNWITSGTIGENDELPYFLNNTAIIDLDGQFPRNDKERNPLEVQDESAPQIYAIFSTVTDGSVDGAAQAGGFIVNNAFDHDAGGGWGNGRYIQILASRSNAAYGRRNEVAPKNYATKARIVL